MRILTALSLTVLMACGGPIGEGDGVVDDDEVPGVGWFAELQTHHHDVSGTVEVVDDNTLVVRDFNYDGGGINSRFYVLPDGAKIGDAFELTDNLVGDPFVDDELEIKLGDVKFEDFNAITLWCKPAKVSFGDGVFEPPEE